MSYVPGGNQTIDLLATDQCGNQGTDQLNLLVPPVPLLVDLGPDQTVNCLDQVILTGQIQGGVGTYSYLWAEQGLVLGNATQLSYTPQSVGNEDIALTVSDQCGNQGSDIVTVQVPSVAVVIDLGPDITATCLDVTDLSGVITGGIGSYSYSWSVDGLGASGSSSYTIQTDEPVQIALSVEDQCGNVGIDQLMILVPEVPVNVDLGPDLTVACLQDIIIPSQVSGGIGSYDYSWTDGFTILSITNSANYHTMGNAAIVLSVNDECGNSSTDVLQIIVPPVPIDITLTSDTAICFGESVLLEGLATGGVGDLDHLWLPINSAYNTINPSPGETTTYTYTVSDICGNTASESVTVGVEVVEPGFTVYYTDDMWIELTNHSSNAVSYIWNFDDGTMSFEDDVSHPLNPTGPITVTLTAIGELGCEKSYTDVFYPLADIYVPNTFTPNGDGINDFFMARGHDLRRFEMSIFNRWGDWVFHTEDIDVPWDGSQQGGLYFVPDGVYNYRIVAEGIRGNVIEKSGSVQILR